MIENQIDRYINNYVDAHTDTFNIVDVDDIELTPKKEDIEFIVNIKVHSTLKTYRYRVFGYMDEFGSIIICNVSYTRFFTTGVDFPQHKMFFVDGDELKTFKFDK